MPNKTTRNNKIKISEYFAHPVQNNIAEKGQKTTPGAKINNKKPARNKNPKQEPEVKGLAQMQKAMSRFVTCTKDKSLKDKIEDPGLKTSNTDGSTIPAQDGEIVELGLPGQYFQRSPMRPRLNLKVKTLIIPMDDRL